MTALERLRRLHDDLAFRPSQWKTADRAEGSVASQLTPIIAQFEQEDVDAARKVKAALERK